MIHTTSFQTRELNLDCNLQVGDAIVTNLGVALIGFIGLGASKSLSSNSSFRHFSQMLKRIGEGACDFEGIRFCVQ